MRMKVLMLLGACLLLGAQPGTTPPEVAVAFREGAVVVEAPAGAHLKSAFMDVRLAPDSPGRLQAGPLPPTNGRDELGEGIWRGPVRIPLRGEGLGEPVELRVTYQLCTEGAGGVCYPPTERPLRVSSSEFRRPPAPARGLFWTFLGIFAWGLGAALTPCVYPMIPITLAIAGAKGGGFGGLLRSLALVLGMATTYTGLGVFAAAAGPAFGATTQHPAFLVAVSVLLAGFAVSLFGAWEIRLPAALQAKLQGGGPRKGILGAFAMGLVLGPLSAPCVGPVIGSILVAIAAEGKVLLGALQLFIFSLGMGTLFLVVGASALALPRSGAWLERVKKGMGLLVLGYAVWNLRFLLPPWLNLALWSLTLLLGAGVFEAFAPAQGLAGSLRKGLGLLALLAGLVLGIKATEAGLGLALLPAPAPAARSETWRGLWTENDYEEALARAKAQGKPLVVDVWAEWCAACKELDEKTWPDPAVSGWIARNAVAVRVDTYAARKDLEKPLRILGYPTVLVVDGEGRILRRQMGFLEPGRMLAFLENREGNMLGLPLQGE